MFSSSTEIFFVERTDDFRVVVVAGMNEQKKKPTESLSVGFRNNGVLLLPEYCGSAHCQVEWYSTPDDSISSSRVQRVFENN